MRQFVFSVVIVQLLFVLGSFGQSGAVIPQGGSGHAQEASCVILKRMGPADEITSHLYSFGIRGKQFQYVEGKFPNGFPFHGRLTDHDVRNLQGRGAEVIVLNQDFTSEDLRQARADCRGETGKAPVQASETAKPSQPQTTVANPPAKTTVGGATELNVSSTPSGADIEMDGKFVGSTPSKTWLDYYRPGLRALSNYKPIASLRLDEITSEHAADFAAWRQSQGLQVSSVNSTLQVLRRILHVAADWGVIEKAPKIKLLPGGRHREHVVGQEEEARYLSAAPEPLASVATVLADSGMRPDECYQLRWEAVTWINGRNGTLLVTHGKTAAARRVLPMTPRVRTLLQARWENAGQPAE